MTGMIRVEPGTIGRGIAPAAPPLPEEPDAPDYFPRTGAFGRPLPSVLGAAFDIHSDITAAADLANRPIFKDDPDYAVMDDIGGTKYEQFYLDDFVGIRSKAEAQSVMSRIDREEKQRETYAAGGFAGIITGMAASVLSPTSFIPIGGWLRAAGKAGRIALRAGEGAAMVGGAVAIQEGVLQAAQETRTGIESLYAIGGGVLLGSVLGGAVGLMTRADAEALARRLIDIPGTRAEEAALFDKGMAGVGAASVTEARGTGEAAGALGVEKGLAFQGPGPRLQTSPNPATRDAARDLWENPNQLGENSDGIATSSGGSAESNAKIWNGVLAEKVFRPRRRLYGQYFFGKPKFAAATRGSLAARFGKSGKLSYKQFNEAVSEAALHGDMHAIPEVAEAARIRRAELVNPLRDEAIAVHVPGFKERVAADTADESYLTRMWNTAVVRARRNDLVGILAKHFEAHKSQMERAAASVERKGEEVSESLQRAADVTLDEIRAAADDVVDNILGHSPGRVLMPADVASGPRGPLKERMLRDLPTMMVRDFVERDVDVIDRAYTRTMATDIALMRKLGSVDGKDQIAKINDAANKASAGKSEKEVNKIQRRKEADIADLTAVIDRLRGTYALPKDTEGLIYRAARVVRDLNYLRLLGGMTLSAIPDLARPMAIHGMTRALGTAFAPFTAGLASMKLAAREARLAGVGNDLILDDTVMSRLDIQDEFRAGTGFERGLSALTRDFGVVSLMAPWNAYMRQFVGIITQTRMLQAIEGLKTGKVSNKERAYLAAGGIDGNLADRIAGQFDAHGEKNGAAWWANTSAWTDKEAVRAFRSFIVRDVDRTILIPGQEKPLWMSTELGKVIGQFKSFSMASTQRVLISGLEQRDMAALNGAIFSMALGAMTAYFKMEIAGADTSKWTAEKWAIEAFDRSGMAGWFMDVNNIAEKTFLHPITAAGITGETASRYASRGVLGALLGPTADLVSDTVSFASTGDVSAADVHVARKLMPLQNIFYLRKLFDQMEANVNDAFGIPARQAPGSSTRSMIR